LPLSSQEQPSCLITAFQGFVEANGQLQTLFRVGHATEQPPLYPSYQCQSLEGSEDAGRGEPRPYNLSAHHVPKYVSK